MPWPHKWDHTIDLVPNAPHTLDCKTYPLAEGQQQELDLFLDLHLRKVYICVSKSPYTLPFFFIKKKDGKPRPVQDYCKLNEITIRNTYPLLLIKELIKSLVKKKWFTKLTSVGDITIYASRRQSMESTFKTNRGLFSPQ
jgi:hypothetical protein